MPSAPLSKNIRILLVEDDMDIREALNEILCLEGYQVSVASNGAQALQSLEHGELPQLILLDLMMPVKDGMEFRREQLAQAKIAGIPVIIMSADHRGEVKSKVSRTERFLRKPVEIDDLLSEIEHACR